ncbi:hypothetical protein COK01_10165 [Priestia megaterium]|jgi:hypothetical protein|uniref:PepSY domain-containing protein n=1 Tax=Priestia megaterium TaxID=1404 RepID=A0AAE5P581_PRIMG|nr:hypothetical protein [Priestia megaterium]RFB21798.1 hypothetical protein DZB87_23925 [Bacillus sp. ALD]RFB34358.1 hypothetical protein DZB86_24575 [Bacillus sp. RC]MDC7783619.1 hypothetical protein [Priestia megaterium]MED4234700.1 hypothetical protein [Priestia megaterium]NGY70277.1 hypothetical protein [Priestia megaterium]
MEYAELGVEFAVVDQNDFNYQLIEKLLKVELGELREQYLQADITLYVLKEEIRETLKAKADNVVQAEADVLAEQEEPSEDPQWEDSQAIAEQGLEEQSVSEEQAVQLVRQKLAIPDSSDTIVELDHIDSDGKYVVHAYNVVIDDEATGEGHNATVAWYTVDPIDGTMVDQFADLQ